jgi:hypothetical protein
VFIDLSRNGVGPRDQRYCILNLIPDVCTSLVAASHASHPSRLGIVKRKLFDLIRRWSMRDTLHVEMVMFLYSFTNDKASRAGGQVTSGN